MRFLALLSVLLAAHCLPAQTGERERLENVAFIEPIFNDNVADYTDEQGEFELNYLPQVFGQEGGYQFGQVFTLSGMVLPNVGVELEYAHFSSKFSDAAEISLQHSLVFGQFAIASGAGFGLPLAKKISPATEPNQPMDEGDEANGKEISAFITLAWTEPEGLSVQANLAPQLEMANSGGEFALAYNAAAHMAFRDFNAGIELNGMAAESIHAIWLSPQVMAFVGPFSLGIGIQVPVTTSSQQTNLTWKFVYEIE